MNGFFLGSGNVLCNNQIVFRRKCYKITSCFLVLLTQISSYIKLKCRNLSRICYTHQLQSSTNRKKNLKKIFWGKILNAFYVEYNMFRRHTLMCSLYHSLVMTHLVNRLLLKFMLSWHRITYKGFTAQSVVQKALNLHSGPMHYTCYNAVILIILIILILMCATIVSNYRSIVIFSKHVFISGIKLVSWVVIEKVVYLIVRF